MIGSDWRYAVWIHTSNSSRWPIARSISSNPIETVLVNWSAREMVCVLVVSNVQVNFVIWKMCSCSPLIKCWNMIRFGHNSNIDNQLISAISTISIRLFSSQWKWKGPEQRRKPHIVCDGQKERWKPNRRVFPIKVLKHQLFEFTMSFLR